MERLGAVAPILRPPLANGQRQLHEVFLGPPAFGECRDPDGMASAIGNSDEPGIRTWPMAGPQRRRLEERTTTVSGHSRRMLGMLLGGAVALTSTSAFAQTRRFSFAYDQPKTSGLRCGRGAVRQEA